MRPAGWLHALVALHPSQLGPNEIPTAYQDVTVQGIQKERVRQNVQNYLQNFWSLAEQGKAPAFFGIAETYKTFGACCIARMVRERALLDVAFVQCAVLLPELERVWFETAQRRLERIGLAPFAVLDDISTVRPNSRSSDMIIGLIERRYSEGLPTVFTGNYEIRRTDWNEITNHFGAGTQRRIEEMTKGLVVVSKP